MEEKRRKIVFSEKERNLLRELILKNPVLVGSKNSKCSNFQKAKAWISITEAYNAGTGIYPRSMEQLKKLWDNIKFKRKLQLASMKKELLQTGDGLSVRETPKKIQDIVDSIAEPKSIEISITESTDLEYRQILEQEEAEPKNIETNQINKRAREDVLLEANLRVKRVQLQLQYDEELHNHHCKEAEFRNKEAELRNKEAELRNKEAELRIKEVEIKVRIAEEELKLLKMKIENFS